MEKLIVKNLRYPIYFGLIFIFLLGIGLRVTHLTFEDIWYDESVTIEAAKMSFPQMVSFTLGPVDITDFPPVYYVLMKGWIGLFGDSPIAVRMSSVLCGVLGILAMFFVGKILFDDKHGLIAALLMAVSPFDIYYSQEVRAYALQVFLISLSIYFFLKTLLNDSKKLRWIYVLITLFAIYIHFFSSFVWAGLFLFHFIYLWRKKYSFKDIIKGLSVHWIVIAGILPILLIRVLFHTKNLVSWVQPFRLPAYRHTLISLLFGIYHTYTDWMYVIGISLFIICVFISLYHLIRFRKKTEEITESDKIDGYSIGLLSWILFLIPVFIFTLISLTIHQIYVPWRYLIIILPGFILVITHALAQISRPSLKMSILILFVILFLITIKQNQKSYFKVGMKSVAEYIEQNGKPADLVLFIPGYHRGSFFYYYRDREKVHPLKDMYANAWFEGVEKAPYEYRRAWVVVDSGSAKVLNDLGGRDFILNTFGIPVNKVVLPPFSVEVYLFEFKKT